MLYVGSGRTKQDRCQIDPKLPVSLDGGQEDDFWKFQEAFHKALCSALSEEGAEVQRFDVLAYGYGAISSEVRGAYLTWLASGKNAHNANIHNVFLYFFGLERRVLLETVTMEIQGETPLIAAEIRRLLKHYGDNASFRKYATSLLKLLDVRVLVEAPLPEFPPRYEMDRQIPIELKVGFAKYVKEGLPIPGPWALVGWLAHPKNCLLDLGKRCPDEFRRMFIERYHRAHGAGLIIKANKTRLEVKHRPASPFLKSASPFLEDRVFSLKLELFEVTATTGPMKILSKIAEECHKSLDRYSRYLGRHPDRAGTIDAILELPISLWPEHMKESMRRIYEWVSGMESETLFDLKSQSDAVVSVRFGDLRSHLPVWQNVTKTSFKAFARSLNEIGLKITCSSSDCPSDWHEILIYVNLSNTQSELNSNSLSSKVNSARTEPVTVRSSAASTHGFSIPECPSQNRVRSLDLDFDKVSMLEADSRRVSEVLHSIFQDPSQDVSSGTEIEIKAAKAFDNGLWGLSAEFSDFLQLLSTRPAWSRAELEELAADRSLMLDGVLEHINEAALDRFDQPFTEGGDPLEINQELIKEINS